MANKFEDALRAQRVRYDEVDEARTAWRYSLNVWARDKNPANEEAHRKASEALDVAVARLNAARAELESSRTELVRELTVRARA